MVLRIVVGAITLISALMLAALLSLRRSRNQTRAANRQLTKALQAKSDFLAMTSHEIRTPLNGILGMTQVILADRMLTAPLRTKIQTVHGAGETMRALVDDILDLSKMETGKLAINRTAVRLRDLLREAASLWRSKADAKDLMFVLDLEGCPALVEEDEDRLRQVVFNLLSNAVKFTDKGSVTLRAKGEDGVLTIAIADTGIGIAPEQHEMIFEKFQQADQSTSRRYGGTGLGLAICRNLLDAMDGTIKVESRQGEGATFTLTLPLRAIITPETEDADPEIRAAPIILLEPNPLTQRIIAKILRDGLGEVEALSESEAMLAALAAFPRSHVIVQAAAAGENLMEIVAAAGDARVVLLAAPEEVVDETALSAAGAVLLRKPIAGDELLTAMRRETAAAA
jgi:nitrogen-specific signal transduction histidine kinase